MDRAGILKIATLIAALAAILMVVAPYLRVELLLENYGAIASHVRDRFVLSLALYFAIYVVVVVFSLPITLAVTMLGGAMFGGLAGGLTTIVAATTGATLIFLAARGLLHAYFVRKSGPWLDRLRKEFHADAASYLLLLRLTPIFPFAVVNLAAGLLGARPWTYVWTTFVGILPGSTAYSYIGSGLGSVLAAEAARLAGCRQNPGESCHASFDPSNFVSRDVAIGLGGLALLVLISIVARRRATKHAPPADSPARPGAE